MSRCREIVARGDVVISRVRQDPAARFASNPDHDPE